MDSAQVRMWPEDLQWVLEKLHRHDQAGRKRLVGTVDLSNDEYARIEALARQHLPMIADIPGLGESHVSAQLARSATRAGDDQYPARIVVEILPDPPSQAGQSVH